MRQTKYPNPIVEQDDRGVKRVTRPMLGFKSFEATLRAPVGIRVLDMPKEGQMREDGKPGQMLAEQFYFLPYNRLRNRAFLIRTYRPLHL